MVENEKNISKGYPSKEQPWKKYYIKEELAKVKSLKTVYQQMSESSKTYQDNMALEYFFAKKNYKELKENVDKTAKAFEEYGVKKGDFVTVCVAGIPENCYTFYALSKLGAVANMIAPHFDKKDLVNRIEDCESDILIVMDQFYDGLKEAIKKSRIKTVIVLPTLNSSILNLVSKKYKLEKHSNEVYWNTFVNDGKKRKDASVVPYEANMPVAMVYSSGTTGASKGILLSNDSFQNSINSYLASGVELVSGKKFYQIIPPWFSTGLSTSMHLPLSLGVGVFMDPRFERELFVKNVIKAKPNYSVAPTSMYEGFLDDKLLKSNPDLSHFQYPFEGGEPLTKEVAEKIEKVFREHNNPAHLLVGYGQCEAGATISTETAKTRHSDASVGIPLPGVNLGIFNDDFVELSYNERGNILANTPCRMIEYYNNEEATREYFHIDENGVKWNCTGDVGYIDENGQLYVEGRASDYTMVNGDKIFNFDIEKCIMRLPEVKNCDVLGKLNEDGTEDLAVHLILNEGCNIDLDSLQNYVYETFGNVNYVPFIFKIRNSFPYAPSGKRDTAKMKEETDDFIIKEKFNVVTKKKEY